MCYHFTVGMPAGTIPLHQFFANGYLWVDLFFILSGFVMAYAQAPLCAHMFRMRTHVAFLAARIARIYPLYLLVIIESACLLALRSGHLDPFVLGCNFAMVQGWGLASSLEGAAWSVSTEWAAYLLFPVLLGLTVLASRRVACGAALVASVALAWLALSPGPFTNTLQVRNGPLDLYSAATAAPLLRCLSEFTFGLLAFRVARGLAASRSGILYRWAGGITIGVALLLLALLDLPGCDLAVVALFCALLVFLSQQTGHLATALGAAIPYRLGQWSYSIYLIHDKFSHPASILNRQLAGHVPFAGGLTVIMTCALVIACSAATFRWIEQPLRRRFMNALHPSGERGIAPLPSAAPGLNVGT
jgi:peptidoglycan/LPS O-acetylase OafA/YrhL